MRMSRNRGRVAVQIFLVQMFCVLRTHDVTSWVINRDSCNNSLPQWSRGWCDKFSLSFDETSPGLSSLQAYPTISTSRLHLWICAGARVLTLLHEDEMWVIQLKVFLSPAPLVVDPSAESRGHESTLGAVPLRCCSASFPKASCIVGRIAHGR